MSRPQTPSQTIGPYFAYGLTPRQFGYPANAIASNSTVSPGIAGDRIRVTGRVLDGAGDPINDAMLEIWQANSHGRYNHPADDRRDNLLEPEFRGFARVGTESDGTYVFDTVKPGTIGDGQAPHINLVVFMRGLLLHVYTRIYFADEAAANATDPALSSIEPSRRGTLLASREDTPGGAIYHLDIHMQGDQEMVFFDV